MAHSRKISLFYINRKHLQFLEAKGLTSLQNRSWRKKQVKTAALKRLLSAAEGLSATKDTLRSSYAQHEIPSDPPYSHDKEELISYFDELFSYAIKRMKLDFKSIDSRSRLVLNLMPFSFPKSVADKIIQGLQRALKDNPIKSRDPLNIIFMTRNSFSFTESMHYQKVVSLKTFSVKFTIIDYRGYSCVNVSKTHRILQRSLFRDVIPLSEDDFYRKLIYGTNSLIGHYLLPNSHVRTHYDLKDFLREDDVFEYILNQIAGIIADYSNVIVVYTGLEYVALDTLVSQLSRFTDNISRYLTRSMLLNYTDIKTADGVLILTDIVNSGCTLTKVVKEIRSLRGLEGGLECYAIAAMLNSPPSIDGLPYKIAARIRREFYHPNVDSCPLCKIKQPEIKVLSLKDFKVHNRQLTPYDFWEIVGDCNALKRAGPDSSGRILAYRIETEKIIRFYGEWLKNVIKAEYSATYSKRLPTKLLSVREPGGEAFARLIQVALNLDVSVTTSVQRNSLERLMTPSVLVENMNLFQGHSVLIVDDGINEGGTIRMLTNFCKRHGVDPMGVFVFDNRLEDKEQENLRTYMRRVPILELYRWPTRIRKLSQ